MSDSCWHTCRYSSESDFNPVCGRILAKHVVSLECRNGAVRIGHKIQLETMHQDIMRSESGFRYLASLNQNVDTCGRVSRDGNGVVVHDGVLAEASAEVPNFDAAVNTTADGFLGFHRTALHTQHLSQYSPHSACCHALPKCILMSELCKYNNLFATAQ